MASLVAETWIQATAFIETSLGNTGTGFFVKRDIRQDEGFIFLITNKHVIGNDRRERDSVDHLWLTLNVDKGGKTVAGRYRYSSIASCTIEHPDEVVDVLAIDVTTLIRGLPAHRVKWTNYDQFANRRILQDEDITQAEEVMIVGYPAGLQQGQTAYPLVRQGIIASRIGERTAVPQEAGPPKLLPAFYIDGGIVPGSSGSPVVLKPVGIRRKHGSLVVGETTPWLLGIVSTTVHVAVGDPGQRFRSLAGLGLAFDSDEIRKTIEAYPPILAAQAAQSKSR